MGEDVVIPASPASALAAVLQGEMAPTIAQQCYTIGAGIGGGIGGFLLAKKLAGKGAVPVGSVVFWTFVSGLTSCLFALFLGDAARGGGVDGGQQA